MDNNDELLTVFEVASKLKIDSATVRYYLRNGSLKGIKVAEKYWRIRASSLNEFLEKTNTPTLAQPLMYSKINEFLAHRKDSVKL